MRLTEHQAKQLFVDAGVTVPFSRHVETVAAAAAAIEELTLPVYVKAQVRASGRMKAGGVIEATSIEAVRTAADELLGSTIRGQPVESVLIEEAVAGTDELYVGITMDRDAARPVIMVSGKGGIDVEAAADAGAVARERVDPAYGLYPYQVRQAIATAAIDPEVAQQLVGIVMALYELWETYDGDELEINPLIITEGEDGPELVAVDAVFNIDDDALFRQPQFTHNRTPPEDEIERLALDYDFDYVRLDGSIGVAGNGAGLVMTTLDLIDQFGGQPANFLDVGGGADADRIENALEILFADPNVEAVLFTIFGGITRCDEVAAGLNEVFGAYDELPVPVVVRLAGTNAEAGLAQLTDDRIAVETELEAGVHRAIELAGEPA